MLAKVKNQLSRVDLLVSISVFGRQSFWLRLVLFVRKVLIVGNESSSLIRLVGNRLCQQEADQESCVLSRGRGDALKVVETSTFTIIVTVVVAFAIVVAVAFAFASLDRESSLTTTINTHFVFTFNHQH